MKTWSEQLLVLWTFCRYLVEKKNLIIHSLQSFLVFKPNRSFELGNDNVKKIIKAQKMHFYLLSRSMQAVSSFLHPPIPSLKLGLPQSRTSLIPGAQSGSSFENGS